MNHLNPNLASAMTIRGVMKECAQEEPAGNLIARFLKGMGFLLIMVVVGQLLMIGMANQEKWTLTKVVVSVPAEPTKEELKEAMKYHGIDYSYQRKSDLVWVFDRENKQCELFAYKEGK